MTFARILVAHDGSDHSWKALAAALDIAAKHGSLVHCVSVREKLPAYAATVGEVMEASGEIQAFFDGIASRVLAEAAAAGVKAVFKVLAGHEVQSIVEYARSGRFDMLVIGFMGQTSLYDRIWGSTSQSLTRLSPCTVLIVK